MISASIAGPGVADRLDVELPELAVAAGLRAVVAEHRPGRRQLHRLRPGLHAVLDVGTDDARGGLRAQCPRLRLLRARREPEQLLLDDVGDLADPALEDRRLLEQRRLDRPVAVAGGEVGGDAACRRSKTARSSGRRSRVPRGARKVGIAMSLRARGRSAVPGPLSGVATRSQSAAGRRPGSRM